MRCWESEVDFVGVPLLLLETLTKSLELRELPGSRRFALMMRSRFSVFMISRQEYVFICKFLSREFFKYFFQSASIPSTLFSD